MENAFLRVLFTTCESVGTPRALTVSLLAKAGEWAQLAQLRVSPSDYRDSESYWADCTVTDFLRKCDLPSGIDRDGLARETFLSCEAQNAQTNVRLSRYLDSHLLLEDGLDVAVYSFIQSWRKDIADVLGSIPLNLTPRFSSGSTYADVGSLITIPDKMSSRPTIYHVSRSLLPLWAETSWYRAVVTERYRSDPQTVRGNVFFTVPKDAKSFRGCCKEASINVSYQLDVGRVMKAKLRAIGIDLLHGQDVHREAAMLASRDSDRATIDLSNASDTLCLNLVKLLLPKSWYELLYSLRAPMTRVDGRWYKLEKFSSMGNGFTFELETLIFATLARALSPVASRSEILCYGDDLIVPNAIVKDLLAALALFGFTPNKNKTFVEGPFRESCGGDYWEGVPVRACFVKNAPNEPQHWIALANSIRRVADPKLFPNRWKLVRKSWFRCLDMLPQSIRTCRGPSHLGDVVIHDDEETWSKQRWNPDLGWDSVRVRAYAPVPVVLPWYYWKSGVQLASCTLGFPSAGITPRGGVAGYRLTWVTCNLRNAWIPGT